MSAQPSLFDRPGAYINTTRSRGDELARYERAARTQEDRILAFYRSRPLAACYAPSQIHELVLPRAPITSVRRAMTKLTDRGLLCHLLYARRIGPYGRPEHFWELARRGETLRPGCLN